ncbi:MAG: HD domain-containing protein [Aquificae bacterium]|nr:HD domain-containing protein [Aquificota bacterium]
MKEFSDPLSGFVRLGGIELDVVDSLPFQRLRFVKQLGVAYLVFPSAQHTRFEHSLGVLEITSKLRARLGLKEEKLLRLSALLHDVGHPPFSHTTEVLLPESKTHEDFTERVIRETEIYDILRKELSHEDIETLIRITLGKPQNEEEKLLSDVITGEFGADRMDYLRRDAYFCGVSYGFFDYERLVSTTVARGGSLVVDESGLRALENFLISRYFMYVQVYFHKSVRILSIHLVEFIKKLLREEDFRDIYAFLRLNDTHIISRLFERKEFKEDLERIFGRKHFKAVLSTEDRERYEDAKRKLLERLDERYLRFDEAKKDVYGGKIFVKKGDNLYKAHELSPLIASLKPIELYRIYVDRKLWKDAVRLLESSHSR